VVPREAAPRSDLKPATIPKRSRPPFRSISGRVSEKVGVFVWVSPSGIKSLVENEGTRMPAKRELTMRQIRQMLRLSRDGGSARGRGPPPARAGRTDQDNTQGA